jgi:short-subunit dehydrogenase
VSESGARPLALVTGASAGLGMEMARVLAERGWDLVVTARSPAPLDALAEQLQHDFGAWVLVSPGDLAHDDGPDRLVAHVEAAGRPVQGLVNNAGFGQLGRYPTLDPETERRMMRLNVDAVVSLTRAFLPAMLERGRGWILNVGSTAGFVAGPRMATYYATKAFVLHYSEALHDELRGSGVGVTCLLPGPTPTAFQERAGVAPGRRPRPDRARVRAVAQAGIDGALAGRRRVVIGWRDRLAAFVPRLLPRDWVTAAVRRHQEGRMGDD